MANQSPRSATASIQDPLTTEKQAEYAELDRQRQVLIEKRDCHGLAESYLRYAKSLVSDFLGTVRGTTFKNLRQDLIGEVQLELVATINRTVGRGSKDLTAFHLQNTIKQAIEGKINDSVQDLSGSGCSAPPRTTRDRLKKLRDGVQLRKPIDTRPDDMPEQVIDIRNPWNGRHSNEFQSAVFADATSKNSRRYRSLTPDVDGTYGLRHLKSTGRLEQRDRTSLHSPDEAVFYGGIAQLAIDLSDGKVRAAIECLLSNVKQCGKGYRCLTISEVARRVGLGRKELETALRSYAENIFAEAGEELSSLLPSICDKWTRPPIMDLSGNLNEYGKKLREKAWDLPKTRVEREARIALRECNLEIAARLKGLNAPSIRFPNRPKEVLIDWHAEYGIPKNECDRLPLTFRKKVDSVIPAPHFAFAQTSSDVAVQTAC